MHYFNIRRFLLTVGVCTILAACGGGGSDDEDVGTTGGDRSDGGGVADGGTGSDGDGETGSSTGSRIAVRRYDLDNNGTFEGVERFSYDAGGRLVRKDATYTDDGQPDHDFDSIDIFLVDEPTQSMHIEYTYDADGQLILEVTTYPVNEEGSLGALLQRAEKTLTWLGGKVTEVRTEAYDPSGALTWSSTEEIEYDSLGRLSEINSTYDGIDPQTLIYTYEGSSDLPVSYEIVGTSIHELTWSDTGLLLERDEYYTFTEPAEHHSREANTYDGSDRLIEGVLTYPDSDPGDNDVPYAWFFEYLGNSWMPARESIDERLDGTAEATIVSEFEEGACETTYAFAQRARWLSGKTFTPYQSGVGYYQLNSCYIP